VFFIGKSNPGIIVQNDGDNTLTIGFGSYPCDFPITANLHPTLNIS